MLASQDNAKQSKRSTTQEQVKKITPGCYTLHFGRNSPFAATGTEKNQNNRQEKQAHR